jgi:hypothetical protein
MTRSTRILAMAAAVAVLAAPCALAMDGAVLKVNVPFDFVVADQQLPSGEYRIVKGQDTGVVRIYSKAQKHLVTAFCVPAPSDVAKGGELVFHKHGSQRFLKSIRTADGFGASLLESRTEKEAQASGNAAVAVGMP